MTADLTTRMWSRTGLIGRFASAPAFTLPRRPGDRPLAPALSTAVSRPVDEARAALNNLAGALRDALSALGRRGQLSPTTTVVGSPGAPAVADGQVGSLGTASTLRTTHEVNEQTSTVRTSSRALGLDTTSSAAPSRLSSTASIGLDVSSAERASTLASSSSLGLDVASAETSSRITSTAEANTMATSYGVVQATFRNGGTTQGSLGNLSGTYAGTGTAANATSLTLQIVSPSATIGSVPALVQVKVTDQSGTNLGTYSSLLTTGQALSLGTDIGLSIAFTAGSTVNNASTTFTVSRTTPTSVDPTGTFNDADVNLRPRFDNDRTVSAGSFTVNGTTVSVLADDSINTVLARVASTVPGITASYSGDTVTIQSADPSEDAITLTNDTSGFLTALNLTAATTVKGNVHDDTQVFSKTTQFAAVTTGAFTVNGVSIAVNPATDSLQSLVTRINGAGAGVTATYDSDSDKVKLTTTSSSEDDIVVANDTTGFLAAAGLATGNTARGNLHDDTQALARVPAFTAVFTGSFTINGVSIAVDRTADTL